MKKYEIEAYSNEQSTYEFKKDEAYLRAKNKLEKLVDFYWHLTVYIVVNIFLIFVNYLTYWEFKWFWFSLFGWGIAILIHSLSVFGSEYIFGRNWEEKKIKQFMEQNKHNKYI